MLSLPSIKTELVIQKIGGPTLDRQTKMIIDDDWRFCSGQ
jgi:hypothetical protein